MNTLTEKEALGVKITRQCRELKRRSVEFSRKFEKLENNINSMTHEQMERTERYLNQAELLIDSGLLY